MKQFLYSRNTKWIKSLIVLRYRLLSKRVLSCSLKVAVVGFRWGHRVRLIDHTAWSIWNYPLKFLIHSIIRWLMKRLFMRKNRVWLYMIRDSSHFIHFWTNLRSLILKHSISSNSLLTSLLLQGGSQYGFESVFTLLSPHMKKFSKSRSSKFENLHIFKKDLENRFNS